MLGSIQKAFPHSSNSSQEKIRIGDRPYQIKIKKLGSYKESRIPIFDEHMSKTGIFYTTIALDSRAYFKNVSRNGDPSNFVQNFGPELSLPDFDGGGGVKIVLSGFCF